MDEGIAFSVEFAAARESESGHIATFAHDWPGGRFQVEADIPPPT
jgi:hypothetical protein